MEKEEKHITQRILHLTLDIIHLLTGEDYTVVKTLSSNPETTNRPHMSGKFRETQSPITQHPPHCLIHGRDTDQKILDLTNKIIHLLTGEVPIRCQDVTVCFSMEEWEYVEGHLDLYKDVIMETPQTLTSQDGARVTERNESPPQDHHDEDLIDIKVENIEGEEETSVMDDHQCKDEEIPTEIPTADGYNHTNTSEESLNLSPDTEKDDITPESAGDSVTLSYMHPALHSADKSSNPCYNEECSPTVPDIVRNSTAHSEEGMCPVPEHDNCFTQNANLFSPQKICTNKEPFSCSKCGKCFVHKLDFTRHQRKHISKKTNSCSDCGKLFTAKSSLVRHQRIHTGERPFLCSECGKSFTQETNLIQHQRIHIGARPLSHSDSGKCFTQKSGLISHQRSHPGEKPFSCSECGKCFGDHLDLTRHQSCHTSEKPNSCSDSGKHFKKKSNIVSHKRIHTRERPFPCSECGRCFTHKLDLIKHQEIHYENFFLVVMMLGMFYP